MAVESDLRQAQLFLDDVGVDYSTNVTRTWHQARKFPDPMIVAEHPWEQWCPLMYGSALRWRDKFRMWYCGWTRGEHRPRVCYAESDDGVLWEKPKLGICEFDGSNDNNIVIASKYPGGLIDDLTVIDDPEDEEWPLKALYWDGDFKREPGCRGVHWARSKDGLHWDRSETSVLPFGDRFNAVSVKVDGKYVVLGRSPRAGELGIGRSVWRTESEDLVKWSDPELVLARDLEDPQDMVYYSSVAFPYESVMIGGLERMYMSPDVLDTEIVWSRDNGHTWGRARQRPRFIEWGVRGSWDDTWINLPANAPIPHQDALWFYYSGRSGAHGSSYPHNHGAIGLATLRVDGFASLRATAKEGFVATTPMAWPGGDLHVNADPRHDERAHPGYGVGEVLVKVLDADRQPVEGFAKADAVPLRHNTVKQPMAAAKIAWAGERSLDELAGQTIRLKFWLREAHLYSFRSVPVE